MNKARRLVFAFFLCLISAFFFSPEMRADAAITTPTPAITQINAGPDGTFTRPEVRGTTSENTDVLVYFDGIYCGSAQGTVGSSTYVFQKVTPLYVGVHKVKVIARNKIDYSLSDASAEYVFTSYEVAPASSTITPSSPVPYTPASIVVPTSPVYATPAPKPVSAAIAPTLLKPNAPVSSTRPLITGLAANNTTVHIYIDGVYNGKIKPQYSASGVANFAYKPFLKLAKGYHRVYAIAENASGGKSSASNELNFRVELPMPAPTLIKVVVNKNTTYHKPFVTGVAKNNSVVKVFLDEKYDGKLSVKNHKSGTANFAYKPSKNLAAGNHQVFTTAVDSRGKESKRSNTVAFKVKAPAKKRISAIAESYKIEKKTVETKTEDKARESAVRPETQTQETKPTISTSPMEKAKEEEAKKTQEEEKTQREEINKILDEIKGTSTTDEVTATATSASKDQSKTKLNLLIFLVFLIGVIAWIFWVNRELIKERKEQEGQEPGKKEQGTPPATNS